MSDRVARTIKDFCAAYGNPTRPLVTVLMEAADELERLEADREKYFLENLEMKVAIERKLNEAVAAERERCIDILRWNARDNGKLIVNNIVPIIAEIRKGEPMSSAADEVIIEGE